MKGNRVFHILCPDGPVLKWGDLWDIFLSLDSFIGVMGKMREVTLYRTENITINDLGFLEFKISVSGIYRNEDKLITIGRDGKHFRIFWRGKDFAINSSGEGLDSFVSEFVDFFK